MWFENISPCEKLSTNPKTEITCEGLTYKTVLWKGFFKPYTSQCLSKNINFGCLVLDKTKALQDNALLVISTVFMDLNLSKKCTNDIVWIKAIGWVTQLKPQECFSWSFSKCLTKELWQIIFFYISQYESSCKYFYRTLHTILLSHKNRQL